jgi:uncharacterized protein YbjT (DUF2867 family)
VAVALVAGATGLVGRQLVRLLAADASYERVRIITRRPLDPGAVPPELALRIEPHVFPFDEMAAHPEVLAVDHVFCALGTTRAQAGSKAAFRHVDLHYPRRLAELTRAAGARHFSLVSAMGAQSDSPFFYSRVKAEAEAAVRDAGFPSAVAFRPSVLGGDRQGRPLERLAQVILRLAPRRWRTVDAADVARAMIAVARAEPPGWTVVESADILARAGG